MCSRRGGTEGKPHSRRKDRRTSANMRKGDPRKRQSSASYKKLYVSIVLGDIGISRSIVRKG